MPFKKSYTQIERARMLYATFKNRLRGQQNPFVESYPNNPFEKFVELVVKYYGTPCHYCQEVLTTENISLDHVVPLRRGGTTDILNLDCICKRCNRRKGELTNTEYRSLLAWLEDKPDMKAIILRRLSAAGFMFFRR